MNYVFRQAVPADAPQIWTILAQAIARRKADGSDQWQDGYPNPDIVTSDIEKGHGYVLANVQTIVGYSAVMINDEPAYAAIDGRWLTEGNFVVYHRVAIAAGYLGQGLAQQMLQGIEDFARAHHIRSVRADTNFDNVAMLRTLEKLGYVYCGEVTFRDKPRRAYEKLLVE